MKNIWSDYAGNLFRPFRAGLFVCRRSVGFTHGYSCCSPSANREARHLPTLTGNSTSESSQRVHSLSPLPGGEGQGEGERYTNFSPKFVRGMIVRGIKTQSEESGFPIPLTIIPLTQIPLP
jgi:hypothetical protein